MKMQIKEKPIDKKYFLTFGGIALILLSLVFIIGYGYPIKFISFPFIYLFGIFSYLIFIFIYVEGMFLLFARKPIPKIKIKLLFPLILFLLSTIILSTVITANVNEDKGVVLTSGFYVDNFIKSDFFNSSNLVLISSNYAGGLLGYFLCEILNNVGIFFVYFISIILLFFSVAILILPRIIKVVKNKKAVEKEGKETKENDIDEDAVEQNLNNIEVVKESPIIEPEPNFDAPTHLFSKPDSINNITANNQVTKVEIGSFEKAYFKTDSLVEVRDTNKIFTEEFVNNSSAVDNEEKAAPKIEKIFDETGNVEAKPSLDNQESNSAEELEDDSTQPIDIINSDNKANSNSIFLDEIKKQEEDIRQNTQTKISSNINKNEAEEKVASKPIVKKTRKWVPPTTDFLLTVETKEALEINSKVAEERKAIIDETLTNFGVRAKIHDYIIGPSVTRFNVEYEKNVSSKTIDKYVDDLSRNLGGVPVRFEPIVEGSIYSSFEVPNEKITSISFKEVFESLPSVKDKPLAVPFGKDISGKIKSAEFNKFPHILVAGTTGSGKSIFIHSIILSLIMRNSPDDLRLGIIDPKRVEMVPYKDMPHLLSPIISTANDAKAFLDAVVVEMNDRYSKFEEAEGATSLDEYNEYAKAHGLEKIPYIVLIIDEYGDLVETCKEISSPVLLLGQKSRACGIHMLISTQSPNSQIITSPIRNNLPTHVALQTSNVTQSISILGCGGGEKLQGKGDMLVQSNLVSRVGLVRIQGCYAQKKEILTVVKYLKDNYETHFDEKFLDYIQAAKQEGKEEVESGAFNEPKDIYSDPKYISIRDYVMSQQYMSMSRIQADCSVGFNKARKVFTALQKQGVVALETEGNKGCRVLIHDASEIDDGINGDDFADLGD